MSGQGQDLAAMMDGLGLKARKAAGLCSQLPAQDKARALRAAAQAIRSQWSSIEQANQDDLAKASQLSPPAIDRLQLDRQRIEQMASSLEQIADLPDPIGGVLASWRRPNGLEIQKIRVPLGVIGMIYESRPNVTAEAAGLCLKSGNAVMLRCGSESFGSCQAIASAMAAGLSSFAVPDKAVQLIPTSDRSAVAYMLTMTETIDVLIPRGGRSLIERIKAESRIPVLQHLDGICHVYLDGRADLAHARAITLNAKLRRTSICGAAETLLIDRRFSEENLSAVICDLLNAGCEVRGDQGVSAVDPRVQPASQSDWHTEYLDAIISAKLVDGVEQAVAHINQYGSHHTDAIVTEDQQAAEYFLQAVDSGIVLWNASTQFADGGEFGMGAEIGISTGKLHARGPVGAEQLTSYKYVVKGNGQVRP